MLRLAASQRLAVDRQPPQRDAGRGIDRVAQRWRTGSRAGLADPAGILAALDDVNVDLGDFVDAQHAIIVEVRLPHAAALDGDFAPQRRRQAEDQATLQLRGDSVGINGNARINCGRHPAQMHFAAFVNLGFHDGGDEAAERRLRADAATGPRRQRLTPAGFLRNQSERGLEPRGLIEHADAERDRIDAGFARQFVHEAFGCKDIVVRPDAAPEAGRHRGRLGTNIFDLEIRNVVGIVYCAIDRINIDTIDEYRWRPARHDRRARYPVFPGGNLAARQGRGNHVAIGRTINIVLDVLFAGPDDFHRPVNLFANADGGRHHVGFEPAAEAAANEVIVRGDLL